MPHLALTKVGLKAYYRLVYQSESSGDVTTLLEATRGQSLLKQCTFSKGTASNSTTYVDIDRVVLVVPGFGISLALSPAEVDHLSIAGGAGVV